MDVEETEELVSLDTDLLQLQEVSPFALKSSHCVVEELFTQWLSLPDTCRLVHIYIRSSFELNHLCFSMNQWMILAIHLTSGHGADRVV